MEQKSILKEDIFEHKTNYKNYIIGMTKDKENTYIKITIASKNKEVIKQKQFTFEEIEQYDPEFFVPFYNNFLILYKFLIRLLKSNLIDIKISDKNKNIIYLNLNCLKDNQLRVIKIEISNEKNKERLEKSNGKVDNLTCDPAPIFKKTIKNINQLENKNNTTNKDYIVKLKKNEYPNYNYEEIKIEIINIIKEKRFYNYLNLKDIFDKNIPYYNELFDLSIDEVYDDLNIILFYQFLHLLRYNIKFLNN